jgi:hypothetical protein
MATFRYQGMNHEGEDVDGVVEAADEYEARDQIRALGYFVTKLDRVDESGAEPASLVDALDAQLLGLLRQGHKIQAIKVYRDASGVGLADAKDYVEALARSHGLPDTRAAGCARNAAVFVVLLALAFLISRQI